MNRRIDQRIFEITGVSLEKWLSLYIQHGYSSREIARQLNISQASVRNYARQYGLILNPNFKPSDWGWSGYHLP